MKRLLLPALCALIAGHAGAAPVSPDEAKHAVAAWLATTSVPDGDKIASIRPSNVISYEDDDGTALFYVVVLEEGGFVVTAADDTISPILSYSTTGDPPDEDPRNPFWALTAMSVQSQMVAAEVSQKWTSDPKADTLCESVPVNPEDEWDALLGVDIGKLDEAGNPVENVSDIRIAFLLAHCQSGATDAYQLTQQTADAANVNWNYKTTYKYKNISQQFGSDFASKNYANWPWGCGVVAVAKVMMYWGRPNFRPAGFSYQPPTALSRYDWLSIANASSGTYWISSVALLSDVGEAMGATYEYSTANGKMETAGGTHPDSTESALKEKFGYASTEYRYQDEGLDEATFRRILCSNLDAKCPVIICLPNHGVVADGYGYIGNALYYHLDLCWGSPGYHYWWKLPSVPATTISKSYKRDYNGVLGLTYNILPDDLLPDAKTKYQIISGRVTGPTGAGLSTAELFWSGPNASKCLGSMDSNGIFYILVPQGSASYTITAQFLGETKTKTVELDGNDLNYWGCDFSFGLPTVVPGGFAPGEYGSSAPILSFNANGGKVSTKSATVKPGAAVGALPTPTRKGYVFTGWYTAKSGGAKVSAATKITRNTTLYAQWAKRSYKVKFVANGGTGKMSVQKMTYGKAKKLSANKFKRKGYVFLGWSKKKNGALAYKNKKAVKNLTKKGGTVKLYAKWGKKVVVRFNANGGTVKKKKLATTTGKKLGTLPKPTRKNWNFEGWWTKKKGGKRVTASTKASKSMTLYARWSSTPVVSITFDPNGGSLTKTTMKAKTYRGSDGAYYLSTTGFPTGTRKNHYLSGFTTQRYVGSDSPASTFYWNITVSKSCSLKLYAQWKREAAWVYFDCQGGDCDETCDLDTWFDGFPFGEALGWLPTPEHEEGYEFLGWYSQPGGKGKRITVNTIADSSLPRRVYANWGASTTIVTFDPNGGTTSVSPISLQRRVFFEPSILPAVHIDCDFSETGSAVTRSEDGVLRLSGSYYEGTFLGWSTAPDGGILLSRSFSVSANTTLYARWAYEHHVIGSSVSGSGSGVGGGYQNVPRYTVTFDANGGSGGLYELEYDTCQWKYSEEGSSSSSPSTKMLSTCKMLDVWNDPPSRSSYVFLGWWTEPNGGTQISFGDSVQSGTTLYARWESREDHLARIGVTFD